jgi:hypothetical protein
MRSTGSDASTRTLYRQIREGARTIGYPTAVRFSSWYCAAQISEQAPARPGVFQVRVQALITYPTGRSAMIHYAQAEDLRLAAGEWAAEFGSDDARYRHLDELGSQTPQQVLDKLLTRFRARFGAVPGR